MFQLENNVAWGLLDAGYTAEQENRLVNLATEGFGYTSREQDLLHSFSCGRISENPDDVDWELVDNSIDELIELQHEMLDEAYEEWHDGGYKKIESMEYYDDSLVELVETFGGTTTFADDDDRYIVKMGY